jgi:Zn-finger nucleic acid-binding protein
MCPGCGAPLIIFELHGVEVDYCPACGGTWLDAGELEQIAAVSGAPTARLAEALRRAREGGKGQRRCPRCRRRMRALQVGEAAPVTLDRCPAGHGLWFDRGELESVIRQCGEGEHGAVGRFFGELFRHELGGDEK